VWFFDQKALRFTPQMAWTHAFRVPAERQQRRFENQALAG
jgi:hypothetical protein